jgi:hypothetical protein
MSGVYAYCVLPPGSPPPDDLFGIQDSPVRGHDVEGLTVWVSPADRRPALELAAVSRHHEVVQAALGEAVVPLRFGAWAPDLDAMRGQIRDVAAGLDAALRRLRGRIELGLRIVSVDPATGGAVTSDGREPPSLDGEGSGRAYLEAISEQRRLRAVRRRAQDHLAGRLRAFVGDMAVDQRVRYLSPPELLSAAHLVEREREGCYRERAAAFAEAEQAALVVHVTGPWVPYSFTDL